MAASKHPVKRPESWTVVDMTVSTVAGAEIRNQLDLAIRLAGGQRQWGRQHGFSAQYLSTVLAGKEGPSDRLLECLGYRKVVIYMRQPKD